MQTTLITKHREMKRKHPDSVLLFRVGDFYESINMDAIIVSDVLALMLIRSHYGREVTEFVSFPYKALDSYLPRLVRAGYRVAICDLSELLNKEN